MKERNRIITVKLNEAPILPTPSKKKKKKKKTWLLKQPIPPLRNGRKNDRIKRKGEFSNHVYKVLDYTRALKREGKLPFRNLVKSVKTSMEVNEIKRRVKQFQTNLRKCPSRKTIPSLGEGRIEEEENWRRDWSIDFGGRKEEEERRGWKEESLREDRSMNTSRRSLGRLDGYRPAGTGLRSRNTWGRRKERMDATWPPSDLNTLH